MRLPCDATLVRIIPPTETGDPAHASRDGSSAEANIARLLKAWRFQGLPVIHIRQEIGGSSPSHADGGLASATEAVIAVTTPSAFDQPEVEGALDLIGATTLIVAGAPTHSAVEATVRNGAELGYRIFVVGNACWVTADGPVEQNVDAHGAALANMRNAGALIVDTDLAVKAAATAMTRSRRDRARRLAQGPG